MTKDGKPKAHRLTNNSLPEDEDVVISGISVRFPKSDNIHEFRDNLMNKVDCITHNKEIAALYGLPSGVGRIKDLRKFDAEFFDFPERLTNISDPQLRVLFEVVYEAILDAGIHPDSLRGSRTGVFCGNCFNEMHENIRFDMDDAGDQLLGNIRAFQANHISYFFDFVGPSYTVDTGCSSAFTGLDNAVEYIQTGVIGQAIVCSTNLMMRITSSLHFQRLGMLSPDSKCKTFDAAADGYVRAQSIGAVFVQRLSTAKRLYFKILHIKTNSDGHTIEGITFPSAKMQKKLILSTFEEAGIHPKDVAYVEAHGTGTTVGDLQEVNVLADVFCPGRDTPVLVGSVKSNMGHSEASAAICQLAKIVIAAETGLIPPNIHLDTLNPGIPSLLDGSMQVVTDPTPWDGGIVAVSSFGFGGTNTHAIFKTNDKIKKKSFDRIPKLFAVSGRTEEAVDTLLSALQNDPDPELLGLLSDIIDKPSPKHSYRGYTILNNPSAEKIIKNVSAKKSPLWFAFPGLGSQWVGMARDMMCIKMFQDSMLASYDTLRPHGINLMKLIKMTEEEEFNKSITNAFVAITSVQLAMLDCLSDMGIEPDGVIGCSIGELACAYADGCLTAEQAILVAYWIGHFLDMANFPEGAMADVGISAAEVSKRFPGVSMAVHQANELVTVTGTKDAVKKVVDKLQSEKIYARTLYTCGKAFHYSSVDKIVSDLMKQLDQVIPEPKQRSSRWISTAFSKSKLTSRASQTASSAYFTNNLVSCVCFRDGLEQLPGNAIVIEVGSDNILNAAIADAQPLKKLQYFGLANKTHPNQLHYFLNSLGQLYMTGYNFCVSGLYPAVEYPVSVGTGMISPLIKWDHSQLWFVPTISMFKEGDPLLLCSGTFELNLAESDMSPFYLSHVIDGKILFPATGYLVLMWEVLSKIKRKVYTKMSVQFENVKFHRATMILEEGSIQMQYLYAMGTGKFELLEGNDIVVSGYLFELTNCDPLDISNVECPLTNNENEDFQLDAEDIYKELRLRGYEYGPDFQGILSADLSGRSGRLKWTGNWVTYLDTVLQFAVMGSKYRYLRVPTGIKRMKIIPTELKNDELTSMWIPIVSEPKIIDEITVWGNLDLNLLVAGGVVVQGLETTLIPRSVQPIPPTLEEYTFIPYDEKRIFAKIPQIEEQLQEYYAICCNIIQQGCFRFLEQKSELLPNPLLVLSVAKMIPPAVPASSTKSYDNSFNFVASLKQILEDLFALDLDSEFEKNVAEVMKLETLMKDSLLSSCFHWRALKPCLDVVVENTAANKVKVVEVDSSRNSVVKSMVQSFASPVAELICSVTELTDEKVNALKETNAHAKCVRWNVEQQPFVSSDNDLIVCINLFTHHQEALVQCIKNIAASLKPGGFILFFEMIPNIPISCMLSYFWGYKTCTDEATFKKMLHDENLSIVLKKSDGILNNIFLVRKQAEERSSTRLPITLKYENWLETLKNKHATHSDESAENLWLVSEKEPLCGILGLTNSLRAEGNLRVRCIFNSELKDKSCELPPYEDVMKKDLVMNVYQDGQWGSYRFLPIFQDDDEDISFVKTAKAHIHITRKGDLSSLQWYATPERFFEEKILMSHQMELVEVYYASLNFRDVLLATGRIFADEADQINCGEHLLGFEFSGRTRSGKRVCGCVPFMGISTTVMSTLLCWEVPDRMTLEEAATVPLVYVTVLNSFLERAHLQPGESVLIHSGTGAIGQCAINVALFHGCKVFATVGSEDKKKFLKKKFPQLTDADISCSRDLSFEQHIIKMTNGKGVDVILNSLADEKLHAGLRCLAINGRFVEIGKYDLLMDTEIEMKCFQRNASYISICFDKMFDKMEQYCSTLKQLVGDGFENGMIQPLNRTVFESNEIENAFRYMATGKHIGKVLIKMRNEEADLVVPPTPMAISAIPCVDCDRRKAYIITGGLGGFGLELAYWLIEKGARNITLNSRSKPRTGYQMICLKMWKSYGINVITSTDNIATREGAENLIKNTISKQGPIGGIFHLAMVLKDALVENQTEENFHESLTPKVNGAMELDRVSRLLCPQLDWFVLFSSIVSGRGNVGQTNYAFANSALERIVLQRRSEGLCGLAIEWGIVGDVGVVYELLGGNKAQMGNMMSQSIKSCLSNLEKFIFQPHPVVSCMVLAPKFGGDRSKKKQDMLELFCKVFGLKKDEPLNPNLTLAELGMDSLMGVEIKQVLQRDYNKEFSVQEIRALSLQDFFDMENTLENQ